MSLTFNCITSASLIFAAIILFGIPGFAAARIGMDPVQVAVVALENRFIAHGVVVDKRTTSERLKKFRFKIEKIEPVPGFINSGAAYQGKEIDVLSENDIPPSLKEGARVSVVLRVVGDEWRQSLFLVEVINHESQH